MYPRKTQRLFFSFPTVVVTTWVQEGSRDKQMCYRIQNISNIGINNTQQNTKTQMHSQGGLQYFTAWFLCSKWSSHAKPPPSGNRNCGSQAFPQLYCPRGTISSWELSFLRPSLVFPFHGAFSIASSPLWSLDAHLCRDQENGVSSWGHSKCCEEDTSRRPLSFWLWAAHWITLQLSWIWSQLAWQLRQISEHSDGPFEGHNWKRWTFPKDEWAHIHSWTFLQKETRSTILRWLGTASYPIIKAIKPTHYTLHTSDAIHSFHKNRSNFNTYTVLRIKNMPALLYTPTRTSQNYLCWITFTPCLVFLSSFYQPAQGYLLYCRHRSNYRVDSGKQCPTVMLLTSTKAQDTT